MEKQEYIKIVKSKLKFKSKEIMLNQIEKYYKVKEYKVPINNYKIGDSVYLKKGTLLHGTYKNIDGLKEIVKNGLISSWFIGDRRSKYPSSVGVWNLKKDYLLKDYINFYSGGTIMYYCENDNKSDVISYDNMKNFIDNVSNVDCHMWTLQQTKEARFMPSLIQNKVQIGIIFNGLLSKELLEGDILNNVDDKSVKPFVNSQYYKKFIIDRKNKDDFFTDRESAILFGIPSNLIEGILVGREYEKDNQILKEIKSLLPNCYICNLDGVVIA